MNTDDIIRMARVTGLCDEEGRDSDSIVITGYLERFAKLVAAAERKRFCSDLRALHDLYSLQSVSAVREREKKND
jgi:hypothetical protein